MKSKMGMIGLGLALLLGESLALPPKGSAQENSTDANKRKVRTRIVPDYPSLAKEYKVSGKVKIEASVAAEGHVSATKVIGGGPVLMNYAIDAVKRWRFEAATKETLETVEFEFNGQGAR